MLPFCLEYFGLSASRERSPINDTLLCFYFVQCHWLEIEVNNQCHLNRFVYTIFMQQTSGKL